MSTEYSKRIVCDLDDTISHTTSRDWENAKPDLEVIAKLNELYSIGWEIYIVTARGQLSCNGDSELASGKYSNQIKTWLSKHGVQYHKLSFKKHLATYYIDDKNLSIDQFKGLKIETLQGGWSGATVIRQGETVIKTHRDSILACEWYSIAVKNNVLCPTIHSLVGNTINMEFIHQDCEFNIDEIFRVIEGFKQIPNENKSSFHYYMLGLDSHIKNMDEEFANQTGILSDLYCEFREYLNFNSSFCHGDLSISNIIPRGGKMVLIDPTLKPYNYSSYLLDVSK